MAGKQSLLARQKQSQQTHPKFQQENRAVREGQPPLITGQGAVETRLLKPADLPYLQNTAGNRAVVQALRLEGSLPQTLQRQSDEEESSWFDSAVDWVSETASEAVDSASQAAGQAYDWASEGAGAVAEGAGNLWESGVQGAENLWDTATDVAGRGMDLAGEGAEYLWERGVQGAENLWGTATDVAGRGLDLAGEGAEYLWERGVQGAQNLWDTASGIAGRGLDLAGEGAETIWDLIESGWESSGLGKPFSAESGAGGMPPTGLLDPSFWEGVPGAEGAAAELAAIPPSTYRMNELPMTTYKITGDTIADVGQELDVRQSMWGEAGHVSRTPSIDTVTYETTGKVARVDYVNTVQKEMPEWTKKDEVGKTAPKWLAEWNRFYAALDAHENGHLNLYKSNFGTGKVSQAELAKFKGIDNTPDEIDRVEEQIASTREEAQDKYEASTNHGLPATKFNAGIPRA